MDLLEDEDDPRHKRKFKGNNGNKKPRKAKRKNSPTISEGTNEKEAVLMVRNLESEKDSSASDETLSNFIDMYNNSSNSAEGDSDKKFFFDNLEDGDGGEDDEKDKNSESQLLELEEDSSFVNHSADVSFHRKLQHILRVNDSFRRKVRPTL